MINLDLRGILIPRKMTLKELSKISGINQWTLDHISQQTYKSIKIENIQRLCDALNISPNELFGYSGEN